MLTFQSCGREIPFASAEEVKSFANQVREAGGADALEALLPSQPGNPRTCLIANALNFGCEVVPEANSLEYSGERVWVMHTPNREIAVKLARALGLRPWFVGGATGVILPRLIGNAAAAFDWGAPEFDEFN